MKLLEQKSFLFIFPIIIFLNFEILAQFDSTYDIALTITQNNDGGVLIEKKKLWIYNLVGVERREYKFEKMKLNNTSKQNLIKAVETAKKWEVLNRNHKKSFEKEIIRFEAQHEISYKNAKINFIGNDDGGFAFIFYIESGYQENTIFWKITSEAGLTELLHQLQGKSINPDIDNIFKKD